MYKLVQYALQPAELELDFHESRLASDKRRLARVFWFALIMMGTFATLGFFLVPASSGRTTMNLLRLVGLVVLAAGLLSLRKVETKRLLDWVGFVCVAWLIAQVGVGHFLRIGSFEAMVAWDVFILFLLYLALPVPWFSRSYSRCF